MLGIPLLPPFTYIIEHNIDISHGVNFALASSRILDETGRNLVIPLLTNLYVLEIFILCVLIKLLCGHREKALALDTR
jgi:hypothetical protein